MKTERQKLRDLELIWREKVSEESDAWFTYCTFRDKLNKVEE